MQKKNNIISVNITLQINVQYSFLQGNKVYTTTAADNSSNTVIITLLTSYSVYEFVS